MGNATQAQMLLHRKGKDKKLSPVERPAPPEVGRGWFLSSETCSHGETG